MAERYVTGCDLVALDDIRDSLRHFGPRFLRRIYTDAEVAACGNGTNIERLAARLAAKEAVIKALALGDEPTVPSEIEVVGAGGKPRMRLHGSAAQLASDRGWRHIDMSLSHTDCHAMAVVVVER